MKKVLNDYILIEEKKEEEKKTAAGIVLANDAVDFSCPITAKVLMVGKNVKEVVEGDEVMYMPRTGIHMAHEDVTWRFLKEDDVIAVM